MTALTIHPNSGLGVTSDIPRPGVDVEAAVVACLVWRRQDRSYILASLMAAHFGNPDIRALFMSVQDILLDGQDPDHQLIFAELERTGQMGAAGGRVRVMEILGNDTIFDGPRVRSYVAHVRRESRRRGFQALGQELQARARTEDDPEALAQLAQDRLSDPMLSELSEGYDGSSVAMGAWDEYREVQERRSEGHATLGVETGFQRQDAMLNGLVPRQLTVIGARSSVGKSTYLSQVAYHASQSGAGCAYLSAEEPAVVILQRCAAVRAWVSPLDVRGGTLGEEDAQRYHTALQEVGDSPLQVYDVDHSIQAIRSRVAQLRRDGDLAVVLVDHLHAISGPGDSPYETRTRVTQSLKTMAMEENAAVILGCQLNRQAEQRATRWPDQGDLRDSSSIMEICDNLILLHRPGASQALVQAEGDDPDAVAKLMREAYAIVEKQRIGGQTGTVKMQWDNDMKVFQEAM